MKMKKIFGVILLVLALLSGVNVFNKLSQAGHNPTGNRSYDMGHSAGMITAPVLLGGIGLWLLLASGNSGIARSLTKPLLCLGAAVVALVVMAVLFFFIYGAVRNKRSSYHPPEAASSSSRHPPL